jgi:hypothetical protein
MTDLLERTGALVRKAKSLGADEVIAKTTLTTRSTSPRSGTTTSPRWR